MTNLFNTVGLSYISGTGLDSTYEIQESIDIHRRRLDSNISDVDFIENQIVDIVNSNITQSNNIFQNIIDINLLNLLGSNNQSNIIFLASNLSLLSNALKIDIDNLSFFENSTIDNINTLNQYNTLYSNLTDIRINNLSSGLSTTNTNLSTTNTKLIGLSNFTLSNVDRIDDELLAGQIATGVVSAALAAAIVALTAAIAAGAFPPPLPSGAPPPPDSVPSYDEENAQTNLPPLTLAPSGNFSFVDPDGLLTEINRTKGRVGINNKFPFAEFDLKGAMEQTDGNVNLTGRTYLGTAVQTNVGATITNPTAQCVRLGNNAHVTVAGEGNFSNVETDSLKIIDRYNADFQHRFYVANTQQSILNEAGLTLAGYMNSFSINTGTAILSSNLNVAVDTILNYAEAENMFINSNLNVSDTFDANIANIASLNANTLNITNIVTFDSNLNVFGEATFSSNAYVEDDFYVIGNTVLGLATINNLIVNSLTTTSNLVASNNITSKFLNVSSNAFILGAVGLSNTLHVAGRTTLSNYLTVNGITTLNGNVGINTSTPQSALHILGQQIDNQTVNGVHIGNSFGDAQIQNISMVGSKEHSINFTTSNAFIPLGRINYNHSNQQMALMANGVDRVFINSNGLSASNININGLSTLSNVKITGTLDYDFSDYSLASNLTLFNLTSTSNIDSSNVYTSNLFIGNSNFLSYLSSYTLSSNISLETLTASSNLNSSNLYSSNIYLNGSNILSYIPTSSNYTLSSNLTLDNLVLNSNLTVNGDTTTDNLIIQNPNTLSFAGATTRQNINLFGSTYGIGIQSGTEYFRSAGGYAFFKGGVHSGTTQDPGTGGSSLMSITTAGSVGIGITNPSSKLHVIGNANVTTNFVVGGTATVSNLTATNITNVKDLNITGNVTGLPATSNYVLSSNLILDTLTVGTSGSFSNISISNVNLVGNIQGLSSYVLSSNLVLDTLTVNNSSILSNVSVSNIDFKGSITGLSDLVASNLSLNNLTALNIFSSNITTSNITLGQTYRNQGDISQVITNATSNQTKVYSVDYGYTYSSNVPINSIGWVKVGSWLNAIQGRLKITMYSQINGSAVAETMEINLNTNNQTTGSTSFPISVVKSSNGRDETVNGRDGVSDIAIEGLTTSTFRTLFVKGSLTRAYTMRVSVYLETPAVTVSNYTLSFFFAERSLPMVAPASTADFWSINDTTFNFYGSGQFNRKLICKNDVAITSNLTVTGNEIVSGTSSVSGNMTVGGNVTIATNKHIVFTNSLGAVGSVNGSKLRLWTNGSTPDATTDYSMGIDGGTMWYNVPTTSRHSFCFNGTETARFDGNNLRFNGQSCIDFATGSISQSINLYNSGGIGSQSGECGLGVHSDASTYFVTAKDKTFYWYTGGSHNSTAGFRNFVNGVSYTKPMVLTGGGDLTISNFLVCRGTRFHRNPNGASAGNVMNFWWTGGAIEAWVDTVFVGNVSLTSDYRIKKNVVNIPEGSLAIIKKIRPVSYYIKNNGIFKEDFKKNHGFIAHEIQALIPDSATGIKDEVNEDGSIKPQTLNLCPIVSHLVKAVQELTAKVEFLETLLEKGLTQKFD